MRALCKEHSDRWCCPMQRPAQQDIPVDLEYIVSTGHVKSFPISSHLRQEMHINCITQMWFVLLPVFC